MLKKVDFEAWLEGDHLCQPRSEAQAQVKGIRTKMEKTRPSARAMLKKVDFQALP